MAEVAERWRRWERTRQMGRGRFVWSVGVCGWGVPVGVLWSIAFWYVTTPRPPLWGVLPVALVVFPMGGYLWGAAMWWRAERGYRAARRGADAEPAAAPDRDK